MLLDLAELVAQRLERLLVDRFQCRDAALLLLSVLFQRVNKSK
jgi:hypothetical protein